MAPVSPLKDILKTSLPAVIDLSSQTIMWTIEAILIGKISAAAFAGVGMALQIIILFFAVVLDMAAEFYFMPQNTLMEIVNDHVQMAIRAGQSWIQSIGREPVKGY